MDNNKLQARNEMVINAPVEAIWSVITNIDILHKINPGVISATGRMDQLNATRTCEINNNGRKGTMTERLIEMEPMEKTVWTVESDTMGMAKMMKHTRFCFTLEPQGQATKVNSETYYKPANLIASLMNAIMMRKMIGKAQEQILNNIKAMV